MKKTTIGLIREEGRIPPDRRVALTPEQCVLVQKQYPHVEILVQPSGSRCFDDDEYTDVGIKLAEDLSRCDILLGIKEVPVKNLIEGKTYLFFSHTLKMQPHNQRLLQEVLKRKIRLIDYECITDGNSNRLIAFGYYAGLVGAYNGILTYGQKYSLFSLKPAYLCKDLEELKSELKKVALPPIKIVLTGGGRVATGAVDMFNFIGIRKVLSQDLLSQTYHEPVFAQLHSKDYHVHKKGLPFDRDDFHHAPQHYKSTFSKFTKVADMLVAGAFWHIDAPVLFSRADMKSKDFKIKVVADITCDINGSIPCTVKPSTIPDPIYDYDPQTGHVLPPFTDLGYIAVMAVDNLPCELPRDASLYFGDRMIHNVLPHLLADDKEHVIRRSTIAAHGKLTEKFEYLKEYAEGA
ncbi:MAG TPA: NAD(P)-dependent oxidoreductase [Cytophagales bacterium]|nr:NAD(P)-dependent oxidoreductase [Cytophagales bacterium]